MKDVPVSISAKDRDLSLAVKGAKMFNLLPRYLRGFKSDQARYKAKYLLDAIVNASELGHFQQQTK